MKMFMRATFIAIIALWCARAELAAMPFFFQDTVGKEAPSFELSDIEGNEVKFSDFQGEKPVMLFFWTTWCPNCLRELVRLNEASAKLQDDGITILAINVQESRALVKRYAEKYALAYPMLLDASGAVADRYKILGVPTYILINTEGVIVSSTNIFPVEYKEALSSGT